MKHENIDFRNFIQKFKKASLIIEVLLFIGILSAYFIIFNKIIFSIFIFLLAVFNFLMSFSVYDYDYTKQGSVKRSIFVEYLSFWTKAMISISVLFVFFNFTDKKTGLIIETTALILCIIIVLFNKLKGEKNEIYNIVEIIRNIVYILIAIYFFIYF